MGVEGGGVGDMFVFVKGLGDDGELCNLYFINFISIILLSF
jgi:hypothetical protein